jgi:hypothetical protein
MLAASSDGGSHVELLKVDLFRGLVSGDRHYSFLAIAITATLYWQGRPQEIFCFSQGGLDCTSVLNVDYTALMTTPSL